MGRKPKEKDESVEVVESSKDIRSLTNQLNKEFGEEGVIVCGDEIPDPYLFSERISTGSLLLDCDIGGGLPRGLTTYIGPESAGKTTMALKAAVEAQKKYRDPNIVYVAAEAPLNIEWAKHIGVKITDNFMALRAATGEIYLNAIKRYIDSNEVDLIIIDSIPALAPGTEMVKDIGDPTVATTAKLVAQFIRRCVYSAKRQASGEFNKTHVVGINQFYAKIGGYSPTGDPKDQQGGKALKHAKLVDIEFTSAEKFIEGAKEMQVSYGKQIKYRTLKCKAGAPEGSVGSFDLYTRKFERFNPGDIDIAKDYRIAGIKYHVLERAGGYLAYGDKNYKTVEFEELINNDPEFREQYRLAVLASAGVRVEGEK